VALVAALQEEARESLDRDGRLSAAEVVDDLEDQFDWRMGPLRATLLELINKRFGLQRGVA
jgi:hypothetical protein